MTWITSAEYLGDYSLRLTFHDGFAAVVDLQEEFIRDHRPILHELSDLEKFKAFKVEYDTVVWDNGADLAPEYLRDVAEQQMSIHTG